LGYFLFTPHGYIASYVLCAWDEVETIAFHEKHKIMRNVEANPTITHILLANEVNMPVTLSSTVITTCTTCFKDCILPTEHMYVFCMILTANKDYFSKIALTGWYF
jgi:hypothetical protein